MVTRSCWPPGGGVAIADSYSPVIDRYLLPRQGQLPRLNFLVPSRDRGIFCVMLLIVGKMASLAHCAQIFIVVVCRIVVEVCGREDYYTAGDRMGKAIDSSTVWVMIGATLADVIGSG